MRLDDQVENRLATFNLKLPGVTIRHLLTHTSGIPNYSDIIGDRERASNLTAREVVATFAGKPLEFAPGEAQRRSTSNYFLLGLIIEQITGVRSADHLDRAVRTAGFRKTVYCDSRRVIKRRARGYVRSGTGIENAPHLESSVIVAAGALCSTAGDLAGWIRALVRGEVIPAEQVREMTTPLRIRGQLQEYGAGLEMDRLDDHPRIHHEGAVDGFIVEVAYYPQRDLSVAVLANVVPAGRQNRNADVLAVADALARAVLTAPR